MIVLPSRSGWGRVVSVHRRHPPAVRPQHKAQLMPTRKFRDSQGFAGTRTFKPGGIPPTRRGDSAQPGAGAPNGPSLDRLIPARMNSPARGARCCVDVQILSRYETPRTSEGSANVTCPGRVPGAARRPGRRGRGPVRRGSGGALDDGGLGRRAESAAGRRPRTCSTARATSSPPAGVRSSPERAGFPDFPRSIPRRARPRTVGQGRPRLLRITRASKGATSS